MWEVDHIARLGYLAKTLFLMHPKDSTDIENRALADEVAKKLKPDAPLIAAVPRDNRENTDILDNASGSLLGFFFVKADEVYVSRSASFSRLAYLIQVRWFLRSKFGFAQAVGTA
jgi:hypothetical protein